MCPHFYTSITKTYRVTFDIQLDNQYKSLVPHYVREDEDGDLYAFVTVPAGGKLPQVKAPVKSGYTFIGWRDLHDDKAPIWNEDVDRVTEDMAFVAVFQKGTVNLRLLSTQMAALLLRQLRRKPMLRLLNLLILRSQGISSQAGIKTVLAQNLGISPPTLSKQIQHSMRVGSAQITPILQTPKSL